MTYDEAHKLARSVIVEAAGVSERVTREHGSVAWSIAHSVAQIAEVRDYGPDWVRDATTKALDPYRVTPTPPRPGT